MLKMNKSKRTQFIFMLIEKSEELRMVGSQNRLCLEIYPKRSNYSIEIRHYYKEGLQKWIVLTNDSLENIKEQQKVIKYLDNIK